MAHFERVRILLWFCPLEIGDNVRVPIPLVDRAPIGTLSLIGTVMDVYSDRGAFQIGTKQGTIQSAFNRSEITPCGTEQTASYLTRSFFLPVFHTCYTAKMPDRQFLPAITTLCSFVVINNLAYWAANR